MPNREDSFNLDDNSNPRQRGQRRQDRTRRRIRSGKGKDKENSVSSEESDDNAANKNKLTMGSITANPVNNPVITINNSSGGEKGKEKEKDDDTDEIVLSIIDYISAKYYDNI